MLMSRYFGKVMDLLGMATVVELKEWFGIGK